MLTALLVDIFVLVWLAMTSDTNGVIRDGAAPRLGALAFAGRFAGCGESS